MVILCLVIGLLIGAGIGGGFGGVIGAAMGWIAGLVIKERLQNTRAKDSGEINAKLERIFKSIENIDGRLRKLEGEQAQSSPMQNAQAASVTAPVCSQEPAPSPAVPAHVEAPALHAAVAAAEVQRAGPAEPVHETAAVSPPLPPLPAKPSPQPAAVPSGPSLWERLVGGNLVVKIGIVILFFGVGFLLKYAYEHTHIPIEVRLIGVAIGAMALLGFGWRLRHHRAGYALALQGGGIGVLYLTIFAAFRLFHLLPGGVAFALLVAMAAFSAVLAVLQDSRALAMIGAGGGFLAPILASTGGGSHVMLFSYYAVLNAGILGVAWHKAWRPLNLLGFAFTFAIGTLWGREYFTAELFASTEPFLVLFFLFYVAIPVLFARREAPQLRGYVDGTLVFGVPLVAFGLQAVLVREFEYGAAWSALALSFFYLGLARLLYSRAGDNLRLLVEAFLALGVVFGTLAIPLALEGRWTSAAWALEGAAIVWMGVRQGRILARGFGIALQFAAGVAFVRGADHAYGAVPVANSFYLGCVFLAVAGLFCAWYLERNRARVHATEVAVAGLLFAWGLFWWTFGGLLEIDRHVPHPYRVHAALMFFAGSCVAFSLLWQHLEWRWVRFPAIALLPLMALALLANIAQHVHPSARLGFIAWPLALVAQLWLLRRHDAEDKTYLEGVHAAGLWLLAVLGSWEIGWQIDHLVQGKAVWPLIAWALVPGALLMLLAARAERIAWPIAAHLKSYLMSGALPLALFLGAWTVYANFTNSGDPAPLPYVPLLNPLDLAQLGAFLVLFNWLAELKRLDFAAALGQTMVNSAFGAAGFIWLNGVLLRTLHHWAGVPFALDVMLRSVLVQASLSIFWSIIALCVMVLATRRGLRSLWIAGAGLMAVVVGKLFLVDLSNVGGIERIVSFIGVGLLMLVIGYFSPVPPKKMEETA